MSSFTSAPFIVFPPGYYAEILFGQNAFEGNNCTTISQRLACCSFSGRNQTRMRSLPLICHALVAAHSRYIEGMLRFNLYTVYC